MAETPPVVGDPFEAGMAMRRRIHGEAHVNRSWTSAAADPQKLAFQQIITESAWGRVWTRDGLPLSTRSLLVIGMLSAQGLTHELETHIRSAVLRNGCTMEAVKETIIQVAIYAGIPRAVDAFTIAEKVAAELAKSSPG
jgi:alkylhydroperoxidase/carboxymuconolactone decarboxylase family protein YurZ